MSKLVVCSVTSHTQTFFTLIIYHGDEFSDYHGSEYLRGKASFVANVAIDEFAIKLLEEIVKDIGYPCDMVFSYHYKYHICL